MKILQTWVSFEVLNGDQNKYFDLKKSIKNQLNIVCSKMNISEYVVSRNVFI